MPELPRLITERLVLRPFTLSDGPEVERLAGVREVADATQNIPHPYPAGAAAVWIATHAEAWNRGTGLTLAICSRDASESLVGGISLQVSQMHHQGEIGYWLAVDQWRKGFATEAARALTAYAFSELKLHRVMGRHLVRNAASARVMRKLGMRHEGVHRDAYCRWGTFEDVAFYAVLESEWASGDASVDPA